MNEETANKVSGTRMRIGVLCLIVWWVPIWALAPMIATALNLQASYVTFAIVAVQTVIGFFGVWVAGKEVSIIFKKTPKKQVPKKVWHVLVHGSF